MGRYRPWTAEEDERLLALIRDGMAVKDTAKVLDRTLKAVEARASRLGSGFGRHKLWYSAADDAHLRELAEQGYSITLAAQMMGRSYSSVQSRAQKIKVPFKGEIKVKRANDFTEEEDATIRRMAANGHTMAEVGEAIGRGRWSVQHRAQKLGVQFLGRQRNGRKYTPPGRGFVLKSPKVEFPDRLTSTQAAANHLRRLGYSQVVCATVLKGKEGAGQHLVGRTYMPTEQMIQLAIEKGWTAC